MKMRMLKWTMPVCVAALLLTACDNDADMGGAPTTTVRSTGERVDDKQVSSTVKDALEDNVAYKFPDVQVQTYGGKVQLSGFVATHEQKEAAEKLAKQVAGNDNVENKITVKQ